MTFHEDDRAQRLLDIFPEMPRGQINVSYVHSTEHVVAWHKHEIQTDYFACIKGSFKVGLVKDGTLRWEYLSLLGKKNLIIEPGTWHGYKALEPNSIMLYYLTEKYNPSDELKTVPGAFGEDWKTISR